MPTPLNADERHVVLYHSPQSRSVGVRALLEELKASYEIHLLNLQNGEQRQPAYLEVNPMGKVPAIAHRGGLVTEQAAIYMYLAELYPEAGLSPAVGDPLRGAYLRWMVFYGSCFEPAVVDRVMKRDPAPPSTSPYGDFDTMFATLTAQLASGPWMLGERFTALDMLWGSALRWILMYKLVPELPLLTAYAARVAERPAVQRAAALDAELTAGKS